MSATGPTLDPVTFEVIRHRLWAINDDQARMAARLSGSFIVYEGYDFNAALVTADGRGLYCGVYILQHGATIDEFVRLILAEWPAEEIREGDMFFTNDPWWGALHANDGILAMPIFWEGELVAWSGIVMHDDDVGSPVPGQLRLRRARPLRRGAAVPGDQDGRELRAALRRRARLPAQQPRPGAQRAEHARPRRRAADDLPAGRELIDEYGLDAFLAAQEGIIDYVERVVRCAPARDPRRRVVLDGLPRPRRQRQRIYPICCRVIKRGDRLTFDLTGHRAAGARARSTAPGRRWRARSSAWS